MSGVVGGQGLKSKPGEGLTFRNSSSPKSEGQKCLRPSSLLQGERREHGWSGGKFVPSNSSLTKFAEVRAGAWCVCAKCGPRSCQCHEGRSLGAAWGSCRLERGFSP